MSMDGADPTPPPDPPSPAVQPPPLPHASPPETAVIAAASPWSPATGPLPQPPHAVAPSWAHSVPAPPGADGAYPMPYWPPAPLPPAGPRVWSALVVPIAAIVVATFAASIALISAAVSQVGLETVGNQQKFMAWIASYGATPRGFLVLVLPAQLSFLACALGAAMLSPVPLRRRLGLNRPSSPWWVLPLLLPATWFAGMCGDLLMSNLFEKRSENLELLYNLFSGPTGAFLILVIVCIGFLPGFGEELLFRGYMQRRLLQRWRPAAAVGLSSLLFAAAHLDPAHVVAVLPMGIWFGVVAWLTGSVWPSILCHTVNNAAAVLIINAAPEFASEPDELNAAAVAMFAGSGVFVLLSLWVMLRYQAPEEQTASDAPVQGLAPFPGQPV